MCGSLFFPTKWIHKYKGVLETKWDFLSLHPQGQGDLVHFMIIFWGAIGVLGGASPVVTAAQHLANFAPPSVVIFWASCVSNKTAFYLFFKRMHLGLNQKTGCLNAWLAFFNPFRSFLCPNYSWFLSSSSTFHSQENISMYFCNNITFHLCLDLEIERGGYMPIKCI